MASGRVFSQLLLKITKQTFLHLEKKFKKKNVLFSWKYLLLNQTSRRIIKRSIFENAVCKGKGPFSTHLLKLYCDCVTENPIYFLYINEHHILPCLKWNQNINYSFFKLLTHIYSRIFNNKSITIFHEHECHPYNSLSKQNPCIYIYIYSRIIKSSFNSEFINNYHVYKGHLKTDVGFPIGSFKSLKRLLTYKSVNVFCHFRMLLLLSYIKTEDENVRFFISLETAFTDLLRILSYQTVLASSPVLTVSYASYMNTFKRKTTAFKTDNSAYCCRYLVILYATKSFNTTLFCNLMLLNYLNGSKINKILRTFINHNLFLLSHEIDQCYGWVRVGSVSWSRMTTRTCRACRWSLQRSRRSRRRWSPSLQYGCTGTSRSVRTTWTFPDDNELEELEEYQTKEEILIFIIIFNFFNSIYSSCSLFRLYSVLDKLEIPFQISDIS